MLTLRLIDSTPVVAGVALALLSGAAFVGGRRLHWGFFVASIGFLFSAIPTLVRGWLDSLAWITGVGFGQPSPTAWLEPAQRYMLLLAAISVVWSTVALLRQDRPNNSLKRTNQSLRD
jgi:hypothetical protein